MEKKEYKTPFIETIEIENTNILEGSTGASGADVPWGAKEGTIFENESNGEDLFEDGSIEDLF